MSTSSKKIDAVVSGAIARLLRQHHFKKDGRTFRKQVGAACQVVNVQSSHGNSWDEAHFYINLGIYSAELAQLLGQTVGNKLKEYQCHIRRRLEPDTSGRWTLTPETDLLALSAEVAGYLEKDGLPWLEGGLDKQTLSAYLQPSIGLESIAAALLVGDEAEAQARLKRNQAILEERGNSEAALRLRQKVRGLRRRLENLEEHDDIGKFE